MLSDVVGRDSRRCSISPERTETPAAYRPSNLHSGQPQAATGRRPPNGRSGTPMRSGPPVGQPRLVPEASLWTSAYIARPLLDGKWVIAILTLLGTHPRRHTDLLLALGGQLSGKVLTENL